MKQIKSITLLMMVFLTVALTGPTTAHAAAISQEGKNEIIAVFVTMIGRAPSATELAELVAMADSGKRTVDVAQWIATRKDFATRYPGFLTADEFSEKLTNDLLGDNTPAENKAQARSWVVGQLKSGISVASVIVGAVQAIRSTTNTAFLTAKQGLSDKVSAAVSSLNAPAPENQSTAPSYYAIDKAQAPAPLSANSSVTSSTGIDSSKIGEILKDLREIAEDLKIEEEDGSAHFKGGLQQATDKVAVLEARLASAPESERAALQSQLTQARTDLDTLSKSPSDAYKKLQALETELTSATTDAQRQAVVDKLTEIQRTLTPWLGFAGNNPVTTNDTRTLTDEGLKNLRAINDRVVSGLTGAGKSCRTRYNSNTHAYELVCN